MRPTFPTTAAGTFVLIVGLAAAGCADVVATDSPGAPSGVAEAFEARARAVAAAWEVAAADGTWRTGFVPLEDLTIPPNGFPNSDMKEAFAAQAYRTRLALPDGPPADGVVRFARGGVLPVPVISARDAYADLTGGADPPCSARPNTTMPPGPPDAVPREPSPPPVPTADPEATDPEAPVSTDMPSRCTALVVTAARPGTAVLRTSRGPATVPAWRFSIAGMAEPIVRVAVAPEAVATPPTPSAPAAPPPGLVGAQHLTGVDGATLRFDLGVGDCDTDVRPLVVEIGDVVVVGGSVRTATGVCNDMLKFHPVTVTLAAPLDDRVVLDAVTGHPLSERRR